MLSNYKVGTNLSVRGSTSGSSPGTQTSVLDACSSPKKNSRSQGVESRSRRGRARTISTVLFILQVCNHLVSLVTTHILLRKGLAISISIHTHTHVHIRDEPMPKYSHPHEERFPESSPIYATQLRSYLELWDDRIAPAQLKENCLYQFRNLKGRSPTKRRNKIVFDFVRIPGKCPFCIRRQVIWMVTWRGSSKPTSCFNSRSISHQYTP